MKLKIQAFLLNGVYGIFQPSDDPLDSPDRKNSLSKEYSYFDYNYWGEFYDYNYDYDHENLPQKGTCSGLYNHATTCPIGTICFNERNGMVAN